MPQGNRDVVSLVNLDIFVNFVKFVFCSLRRMTKIDSSRVLQAFETNEEMPSECSASVLNIDTKLCALSPATARFTCQAQHADKMLRCIKPAFFSQSSR